MKKNNFILLSVFIFSLITFIGLFLSCELETVPNENDINDIRASIKDPGVEVNKTPNKKGIGFTISVHNISDVDKIDHINIYRREITNKNKPDEGNPTIYNIGILYPEWYHEQTWLYNDYYVYNDKYYQYCVKYVLSDAIYKSAWSTPVKAESSYEKTKDNFKYTVPEAAKFSFDDKKYTLTLTDDIQTTAIPKEILNEVKPKVIFKSRDGKLKKAYPIDSLKKDTEIWLRNILEPEFLDIEINVAGIVFEKAIYVDDDTPIKTIKSIVWGELEAIEVIGKKNGFIVKSTSKEPGYDYRD